MFLYEFLKYIYQITTNNRRICFRRINYNYLMAYYYSYFPYSKYGPVFRTDMRNLLMCGVFIYCCKMISHTEAKRVAIIGFAVVAQPLFSKHARTYV